MKSHGASASASATIPPSNDIVDDQAMDDEVQPVDNSPFLNWLDAGQSKPAENIDHGDFVDSTNKADDNAEADVEGFIPYLGPSNDTDQECAQGVCNANANATHDSSEDTRPASDTLHNTYVQVIHSNGIHHLAMVTCLSHGADNNSLDLVASHLLLASFTYSDTIYNAINGLFSSVQP